VIHDTYCKDQLVGSGCQHTPYTLLKSHVRRLSSIIFMEKPKIFTQPNGGLCPFNPPMTFTRASKVSLKVTNNRNNQIEGIIEWELTSFFLGVGFSRLILRAHLTDLGFMKLTETIFFFFFEVCREYASSSCGLEFSSQASRPDSS